MVERLYLNFSTLNEEDLTPFERIELNAYLLVKNLDCAINVQALADSFKKASSEETKFLELAYKAFIEENLIHEEYH